MTWQNNASSDLINWAYIKQNNIWEHMFDKDYSTAFMNVKRLISMLNSIFCGITLHAYVRASLSLRRRIKHCIIITYVPRVRRHVPGADEKARGQYALVSSITGRIAG